MPAARLPMVAFVPADALVVQRETSAEQSASAALDVLSRAASLVNQQPETLRLPLPPALAAASGAQQQLLSSRHNRAHLLCLPPAVAPTAAAGEVASRAAHCSASLQQHAALLLLLLVSDSLLLLLPSSTVPASLLQLLHVLAQVHAQLQQLAAEDGDDGGDDSSSSSLAHLLRSEQQPTQLHIGLQLPAAPPREGTQPEGSWSAAAAAAAVSAAEQVLLKSKAIRLAPAAAGRGSQSSGGGSSSGELVQLAGVHCCCSDGGPNTVPARRRAVLGAIQKQLLQCDQVSSSSVRHVPAKPKAAEAAPADVMPSAEQLLSAVAAAAGAQQHTAAAASIASLPELWQQLLALLFPAAAVDAAASSSATSADPYPLFAAATLGISAGGINAALADEEDTLPSDGSWGEAAAGSEEEGWDEVQQHDEPQHSQQQRGLQKHGRAPGELLATAVDRQYVTSLRCCHIAARRALRAYVQAVPERYTAAVHDRVLAAVLQQYSTAARGPAQQQAQQLLQDACTALWRVDRQLCPVLSLTGHGCSLAPHDASVLQHVSCFRPRIHTPDGAAALAVDDWFDAEAANVVPARQLLQEQQQGGSDKQQQQQRPKPGGKTHKQQQQASGQLLYVVAQLSAGSSSNTNANTSSSSSSSSRGTAMDGASQSQQASGSGLSSISVGPWMSLWQLGECAADAALQGPDWAPGLNRLLQLKVPGQLASGGRDAAAAKAQGASKQQQQQQQHTTLAAQLKRSKALGGQAAAAGSSALILGPSDFPTLEQAVGTTKRQAARKATANSHEADAAMQASGSTADQQQLLMAAWAAMLHEGTRGGSAAAADRGHRGGHAASAGPAGQFGSRPRHGQHAAAAPVAQPGPAEAAAAERPTLTTLWIALEYESLTGQRVTLQPQQLLALKQQQQAGGFGPQPDDRHRRGKGPGQQQQQRHVAVAGSAAGGPEGSSALEAAVQQLLSADLPLHLQPLQLQLPHSKQATASTAGSSSGIVVDTQVLQLQRVYIKTPAAPLAFATRPTVAFSAAAASASGARCIEFACEQPPQQLPPGQLVAINLPKVYAAPAAWVSQLQPISTAAGGGGTQQQQQQQQQPEMVPLVPVQPGVCHGSQAGGWCACLRRGSWLFPAAS